MRKQLALLLAVVMSMSLLSGCWSRKELNQLAITLAMGIDLNENGDGYHITLQIVNPNEVTSKKAASSSPVVTYVTEGKSIFEAVRKITTKIPRKIYMAHLRIVVIGEKMARKGINETLDFLSRDHEFRTDFFVVVSKKETAQQILKTLTIMERIPANEMFDSLESSSKAWGETGKITIDEIISNLSMKGRHPVLTGIMLTGNRKAAHTKKNVEDIDPLAELEYEGLGVFKDDKLIGWLNDEESRTFHYIENKIESTVNSIPCYGGGKITLETIRNSSEKEGTMINGKPGIKITMFVEANVGETQCRLDLTKPETIEQLEKDASEDFKKRITHTIQKVQKKYGSDIFGFGEVIHRTFPDYWKAHREEWDEIFPNVAVETEVTVKIRLLGTLTNSFLNQTKE